MTNANSAVLKSFKNFLPTFVWNSPDLPYHKEGENLEKSQDLAVEIIITVNDRVWKQLIIAQMVAEAGMKKRVKH